MSEQSNVELLAVSDTSAAFIVPMLMYLLGMPIQHQDDEDWTVEEVERNVRTRGVAVCLVMHKGDFSDGVIQCGPRVSQAIRTASRVGKPWCFLVPCEDQVTVTAAADVAIRLDDGRLVNGLPELVTADLRFVLAMVARASRQSDRPKDTTPSE